MTSTNDGAARGPDGRLARLEEWRAGLENGAEGRSLRDEDLQRVAFSSATDAESIARVPMVSNPGVLRAVAGELAEALAGLLATGGESGGSTPEEVDPEGNENGSGIEGWIFVAKDLSFGDQASVSLNVEVLRDGIGLTWPSHHSGEAVVVYRLVSGEQYAPPAPEHASPVATTFVTEAQDRTPFTTAVRYYQVWVNSGPNEDSARAAQPRLHASAEVVAPVQDCVMSEDEGVIVGRWKAVHGTTRVAVHRSEPGAGFSPANELRVGDNLQGFQDRDAAPGQTYQYSVYAIATVDTSAKQSAAVVRELTVSARLDPVADLKVNQYEEQGKPVFDVEWTPPEIGDVRIYRTQSQPNPGLKTETRGLDAIELEGLNPAAQVMFPPQSREGRAVITGVPWPAGWPKAHFTPVTVLGSKGQVGPSVAEVRTGRIDHAALKERVAKQVVVFGWPAGAVRVAAYVTPPGAALGDPQAAQPQKEISKQDYERLGGLDLDLTGEPVDVHLVPKAWDRGEVVLGEKSVVDYPGLLRIAYDLRSPASPEPQRKRRWSKKSRPQPQPTGAHVLVLNSDRDLPHSPDLVLVHNDRRLPISERDGRVVINVPRRPLSAKQWTDACEVDLAPVTGGYVRLFVIQANLPVEVAVLDPDIDRLRRP